MQLTDDFVETSILQLRSVMNGIIAVVNRNQPLQEVILQFFFSCVLFVISTSLIASGELVHVDSGNIYYCIGTDSQQLTKKQGVKSIDQEMKL